MERDPSSIINYDQSCPSASTFTIYRCNLLELSLTILCVNHTFKTHSTLSTSLHDIFKYKYVINGCNDELSNTFCY